LFEFLVDRVLHREYSIVSMRSRRTFLGAVFSAWAQDARWEGAFEAARDSAANGGLVVMLGGRVVYERYYGLASAEAAPNLASVGKAVTSAAVGILLGQKPRGLERGLDTYAFRGWLPERRGGWADIRLGHLLAMSAGVRGNNPCVRNGVEVRIDPAGPDGWEAMVDEIALGERPDGQGRTAASLWCEPGGGYSYATSSVHLASMILRKAAGMELQEFVGRHMAGPLGWGAWNFGYRNRPLKHTPGGGGICVAARDLAKFGEMMRRGGGRIVPGWYAKACAEASPYNPHFGYSLQWDVNAGGRVTGVPRDAFWKSGSGGHALFVIPSLGLTAVKLGGRDEQYLPENTGLPLGPGEGDPNLKPRLSEREGLEETLRRLVAAA
jgi:CubicO group peptidase (beta-lactamase class C family)